MADSELFAILSLTVSIVAVVLAYVDMRRRLKQEREFSQEMARLINTLREELQLFRTSTSDTTRQNLLAHKEEQQWNRLKDIGKAIGWILEHAEDEEE